MNDTWVTVVGNLATEPAVRTTGGGAAVANLRVASTPRRRDAVTGEWKDAETAFLTVTCWRALAEHVGRSLHKGDPVVVHGRLVLRSYETAQGERRTSTEVEATALGPDLTRGTAAFARAGRVARGGGEPVRGGAEPPLVAEDASSVGADADGGGVQSRARLDGGDSLVDERPEPDPWSGGDPAGDGLPDLPQLEAAGV